MLDSLPAPSVGGRFVVGVAGRAARRPGDALARELVLVADGAGARAALDRDPTVRLHLGEQRRVVIVRGRAHDGASVGSMAAVIAFFPAWLL